MAFIRIFQPPNVTPEIYDAVNEEARVKEDAPAGMIFHCAGETDGKWQIIDVWESQEHARRFDDERLGPAIEKVIGMRPPASPPGSGYELHNVIRP
jgi:hypothetical protein